MDRGHGQKSAPGSACTTRCKPRILPLPGGELYARRRRNAIHFLPLPGEELCARGCLCNPFSPAGKSCTRAGGAMQSIFSPCPGKSCLRAGGAMQSIFSPCPGKSCLRAGGAMQSIFSPCPGKSCAQDRHHNPFSPFPGRAVPPRRRTAPHLGDVTELGQLYSSPPILLFSNSPLSAPLPLVTIIFAGERPGQYLGLVAPVTAPPMRTWRARDRSASLQAVSRFLVLRTNTMLQQPSDCMASPWCAGIAIGSLAQHPCPHPKDQHCQAAVAVVDVDANLHGAGLFVGFAG